MVDEILQVADWDAAAIRQRTERLADWAKSEWGDLPAQ
jgi:hypothetical protein